MANDTYLLPVGDTLGKAWDKVYGAKGSAWAAMAIIFAIMFALAFADGMFKLLTPFYVEQGISFAVQVVGFLLQMGLTYIGIVRAKDLPITYRLMFRTFETNIMLNLIGLYILQILLFMIPFVIIFFGFIIYGADVIGGIWICALCCILGGIGIVVIGVRLLLAIAFVLDRSSSPVQAIKLSFAATKHNFWRLSTLLFAQMMIILVSAIPLGIGLIWSIPYSLITFGLAYKELSEKNISSVSAQKSIVA